MAKLRDVHQAMLEAQLAKLEGVLHDPACMLLKPSRASAGTLFLLLLVGMLNRTQLPHHDMSKVLDYSDHFLG